MGKGGYSGGSTVFGPKDWDWYGFSNGGVGKPKPFKVARRSSKKARSAAIARHQMVLQCDRYALLAEALRKEGFSEAEVRRGLKLQLAKDRAAAIRRGRENRQT